MRLTVLVLLFIIPKAIAQYEEDALHFNSDFLIFSDGKKTSKPDLSYFSFRNGILPGTYLTEVVINGKHISEEYITFSSDSKGKVHAVYSQTMLEKWGINIPDIPEKNSDAWSKGLSGVLPGAKEQFNSTEQRLLLFIPQQWLQSHNWLKTSPKSWDDGIPALMFNYRYSGAQQHSDLTTSKSETLSLNSGATLGGWHFRHDGFIGRSTKYKDNHGWQSLNTWARHDYDFFQGGQITIGQQSSDGAIFDSFPFEGIQMSSDDGMIVPWLSRFSPLIRGVAGSVSRIIVRQNNMIIWQGDVPAGPFELRDVSPLFSGDMEVEIRGADGSIRHFTQSTASVPVLQREGRVRYSNAIGRYRRSKIHNSHPPSFMQTSAAIGMSNDFTLYGGVMWADKYSALMTGLGKYNEKIGAFSFDITNVNYTKRYGNKVNSEAIRFSWARDIDSTGTQMNFGAYWYLSPGFYNFNDLQQSESDVRDNYHLLHPLSRITTSLSQPLPEGGQLSLSIDKRRYYNTSKDSWQTRLSWSVPVGLASTTLAFGYERQPQYNQIDRSLFLSFSLPFNAFTNYDKASLSSNLVTRNGDTFVQTGVTGSAFDQRLSYSIMEGFRNHNKGNEGNLNVRYRGSYGEMSTSWSHQKLNHQWLYGLNGGIVAHSGGVTLTQPLNIDGASALIDTNGAPGIRLNNGTGVSTDWQGYTILSNLVPYQRNDLSLDINSAGKNAEIVGTDLTVIPSRGALVPAKFRVNTGRKALLTLTRIDGSPVPFGSVVSVISDNRTNSYNNIVADDGQVWITGLPEEGEILARWGEGRSSECKAHLRLDSYKNDFIRSALTCQ